MSDIETRGSAWLNQHKDDVVECSLRSARFRNKYCYYLQKKIPDKGIDDAGTFNDGLSRAMNICRRCPKYLDQLDVKKFLNEENNDQKDKKRKTKAR